MAAPSPRRCMRCWPVTPDLAETPDLPGTADLREMGDPPAIGDLPKTADLRETGDERLLRQSARPQGRPGVARSRYRRAAAPDRAAVQSGHADPFVADPECCGRGPEPLRAIAAERAAGRDDQAGCRARRHRPARIPRPERRCRGGGSAAPARGAGDDHLPVQPDHPVQPRARPAGHAGDRADGIGADTVRLEHLAHRPSAADGIQHHRGSLRHQPESDPRQGLAGDARADDRRLRLDDRGTALYMVYQQQKEALARRAPTVGLATLGLAGVPGGGA